MNIAFLNTSLSSITVTSSVNDKGFLGSTLPISSFPIPRRLIQPIRPTRITCSSLGDSSPTQHNDLVITPPPSQCKQTPVHKTIPIIGTFIDLFITKQTAPKLARKYGSVYKSNFLGLPVYNVNDINAITEICKDSETFTCNGASPPTFRKMLGKTSLFQLDGHKLAAKRLSIYSAFSPQLFPLYFESILSSAETLWSNISTDLQSNPTVKLDPYTRKHYLRLIVRISTGREDVGSLSFEDLRKHFFQFNAALFSPQIGPIWNAGLRSRQILIDTYTNLIENMLEHSADKIDDLRSYGDDLAKMARQNIKGGSLDVLTVAVAMSPLKTGPGQTHDPEVVLELAELVLLLWFAGYTTQAVTSLSIMMTLGFEDEVRKRLIAEQDAIAEKYGNNEITIQQVNRDMPLLDSCVTEVLRMYPAAAAVFRKVSCDTSVDGHFIPKDSRILIDFWGAQRNEKYYENADEFKVDRFLSKDDTSKSNSPNIITFGSVGSAHFCMGASLTKVSLKATFATLLRHYDFGLDPKQTREYVPIPELRPKSFAVIERLERRKVEKKLEVVGIQVGKETEI